MLTELHGDVQGMCSVVNYSDGLDSFYAENRDSKPQILVTLGFRKASKYSHLSTDGSYLGLLKPQGYNLQLTFI